MDPRDLIERLAQQEEGLRHTFFVAPCVPGGRVRARVEGLVHDFVPQPADFEGWGMFQAADARTARFANQASARHVEDYLRLLQPVRLRLACPLAGATWLAYPVNEADAERRFGSARPMAIHLVRSADPFDQVKARWDGGALWFEAVDRRGDPRVGRRLREALRDLVAADELSYKGIIPEERTVYQLATQRSSDFDQHGRPRRDENRLRDALEMGGGRLRDVHDRGAFWLVEWTTSDGRRHSSAISKDDLTVQSAGICLDGRDRDFDLQSLVGVVENAESWAY